jgi:REP element-mobilizing transposase RayT
VFSTKNRVPSLSPAVREELHLYLATVLRNHDCSALEVGGTADHVHLLFGLSRKMSVAKTVEVLKTSSSKWLKTKGAELSEFFWQSGYGAFSVSQSEADRVVLYIREQETHHEKLSFQEEYRRFLAKHQIDFDEAYMWD